MCTHTGKAGIVLSYISFSDIKEIEIGHFHPQPGETCIFQCIGLISSKGSCIKKYQWLSNLS